MDCKKGDGDIPKNKKRGWVGWRVESRAKRKAAIVLRAESETSISAIRVTEAEDRLRIKRKCATTFLSRER